ncbi:hypothetical protein OHR68_20970 [Spirillospora sp. NBC_00431]
MMRRQRQMIRVFTQRIDRLARLCGTTPEMPAAATLDRMAGDLAVRAAGTLTSASTLPAAVRVIADPEGHSPAQISAAVEQWVAEAVERGMAGADEHAGLVDVLVGELLIERSSLGSAGARNVRRSPGSLVNEASGRVKGHGRPGGSAGALFAPDRVPAVESLSRGPENLAGETPPRPHRTPARAARLLNPDEPVDPSSHDRGSPGS